MSKRSLHRSLVRVGAPTLPPKYYYYLRSVPAGDRTFVRIEIRKSHFMGSSEVARWTVDPSTYWKESDSEDEVVGKIILLCENVVRTCDHFEVSNHVS